MSLRLWFMTSCVILLLSGCANKPPVTGELNEIFVTDIKASGLKLFSYSITVNMSMPGADNQGRRQGKAMHGGGGGMGGGGRGGQAKSGTDYNAMIDRIKQVIDENLEVKLAETGYCRDGYIELDSNIGKGRSQIRGECKEAATESDRNMFSNKPST